MFRFLFMVVVGTAVPACFITPVVFSGLEHAFGTVPWPYSRVFDRMVMLCALISIILFRKHLPLEALRAAFTEVDRRSAINSIVTGAGITIATLALAVPIIIWSNGLVWRDRPISELALKFAKLIPAALVISLIEESFFRLLLLDSLRRYVPLSVAAMLSSALYAVVHFLTPDRLYVYPGYSPFVGFLYLGVVFQRACNPEVFPALLGLFLVGLVLCYAIIRTRSIFLCIGLHSGWVIGIKLAYSSLGLPEGVKFPAGVGRRYFLVAEPIAWASIVVTMLCVAFVAQRAKNFSQRSSPS